MNIIFTEFDFAPRGTNTTRVKCYMALGDFVNSAIDAKKAVELAPVFTINLGTQLFGNTMNTNTARQSARNERASCQC